MGADPIAPSPSGPPNALDESGDEEWIRLHRSTVYRLAFRLTGNHADAEDLSQEVWVRAIRSRDSQGMVHARGWLHRVTLNLFRDQLRRRRGVRLVPFTDDMVDGSLAVSGGDPAHLVTDPILESDVDQALLSLRPDNRRAVLLRDVDGLTYQEISALLGVKRGTVGSRVARARAQLRVELEHRAPS